MGWQQKKPGGVRGPARPRRKKASYHALYKVHRGNGSKRTKTNRFFEFFLNRLIQPIGQSMPSCNCSVAKVYGKGNAKFAYHPR
jgi:hypothetical protein